jgi:hypothetical protein
MTLNLIPGLLLVFTATTGSQMDLPPKTERGER